MDRISQLPESIVHHILSSFDASDGPPAALVRMSVLSKTWFHLTSSFPLLNFNIDEFSSRESFFKYVEYATSRFCNQNLTVHTFKLTATIHTPAELDAVDRCLERALNKGVKVLEITNSSESPSASPKVGLPNLLLSVSVLESLTIHGCELPSSLILDEVKFKSLIKLSLVNVPVDDEVIRHLTTSCPLLQVFQIRWCPGFKRFCVYGHQNLQTVRIEYKAPVERIDIEAPNLSSLLIIDFNGSGALQMNLASCTKLTNVTYYGHPLPNSHDFNGFLSNFPFIKNFVLFTKYKGNNLKLSSHTLRTLVLHSNFDLGDIDFSTPNLVSFIYSCNIRMFKPLVRHLSHVKSCMQCYPDGCIDALWFQELRQFLDKKKGFKVLNLYIHATCSRKFIKLEKLKEIVVQPYELEHVEIQLEPREDSLADVAFVDAVLWCCRPRSFTLRPSSPFVDLKDVAKFTFEKLLEQVDQGHTSIQIVWPSSSETQKNLRDLKSLSMALPLDGKAITFIKEEVIQEAAG